LRKQNFIFCWLAAHVYIHVSLLWKYGSIIEVARRYPEEDEVIINLLSLGDRPNSRWWITMIGLHSSSLKHTAHSIILHWVML